MFLSRFLAPVALSLVIAHRANAESHVIKFVNKCGYGSPMLMYNGKNILTGDTYTSSAPFSGIAYLQTGDCNLNGENCTLLETTLINPVCNDGCGSSTDISLINPHKYNVETSFVYYNGCDGQGKTCSDPNCSNAAFFAPNDNFVQVECQANDVNLLVSFCADATQFVTGNGNTTTTLGGSLTSSQSKPSSSPSSGSSTLGYVPPPTSRGTSSTPGFMTLPSVTPTSTLTPTGINELESTMPSSMPTLIPTSAPSGLETSGSGCDEFGETIPSSTPTLLPTSMPTLIPTSAPSGPETSGSGCDEFGETIPSSAPTLLPTSTPTLIPTSAPSGPETSGSGCDEFGETIPSSVPTFSPTMSSPTLTQTPTVSDPGCDEPTLSSTPASPSSAPPTSAPTPITPTGSPSASPTISRQRCRPRPTSFTTSGSASTNPAPTSPSIPPSPITPMTAPSSAPSAGTGTLDPCGDPSTMSTPSQAPTGAQRRRHRRNRIRY